MSTVTKIKQVLIDWIKQLDDPTMLKNLKSIKEGTKQHSDWWDEISDAAKESIKRGDEDIKAGRVNPHEEVRKSYEKWL